MKVVICGGRAFNDMRVLVEAVRDSGFDISEVVSGGASGADSLAIYYANANGIPLRLFKADWKHLGRVAGPLRNREMAQYAEAVIALPGGRGTADMVRNARMFGLKVYEVSDPADSLLLEAEE